MANNLWWHSVVKWKLSVFVGFFVVVVMCVGSFCFIFFFRHRRRAGYTLSKVAFFVINVCETLTNTLNYLAKRFLRYSP